MPSAKSPCSEWMYSLGLIYIIYAAEYGWCQFNYIFIYKSEWGGEKNTET